MTEFEAWSSFDATTAFIDIRESTALTKSLGVRQMRNLLEEFFGEVLARVVAEDGRICDINGDGVLAIFRGRGRADRALAAAVAVGRMVADRSRFGSVSGIRIGIDDGQVCPGHVGAGPDRHVFWVGANAAAKVSRMLPDTEVVGLTDRAHALLSPEARQSADWSDETHVVVGGERLAVRTLARDVPVAR